LPPLTPLTPIFDASSFHADDYCTLRRFSAAAMPPPLILATCLHDADYFQIDLFHASAA